MGSKATKRDDWMQVRFEEIARHIAERVEPRREDCPLYVGLEHLDSGSLIVQRWGSDTDLIGTKLQMRKGDVLFARRNAYLRRVAIAPHDGLFSAHGMVLRPQGTNIVPEFFPFFMQSDQFMDRAEAISVGSLSPTINWSTLRNEEFCIPPLNEQTRLVSPLTAASNLVLRIKMLCASATSLLESAISTLLHQETLEALRKEGGDSRPNGWEVRTIGEMCERVTYGFTNPMPATDNGPWMVTAKDIVDGRIAYDTARHTTPEAFADLLTPKSRPRIGDVLLTKDGTLGRVALVDAADVCVNQSVAVLQPRPDIGGEFLYWMLRGREMLQRLLADSGGTAVKHLYITKVAETRCMVPPQTERERFVKTVAHLQSAVDAGRCRLSLAEANQRRLLAMI